MPISTGRAVLVITGVLLFNQAPAKADVVLTFEGFSDGTGLTSQIPGMTFSNATVLTAGIGLNEFELPPHSGTNVVFDDGGPIAISFASPILSFSGYFTYYTPLTVVAFDGSSNQVGSTTSAFSINVGCDPGPFCLGDPGSSPNELLSVSFASGISRITITGDLAGGSFVMDDATVASSVPEPSSIVLVLSAMAGVLAIRKKI